MHPKTYGFTLLWITFVIFIGPAKADESISIEVGLAELPLRQFVASTLEKNLRLRAARMALASKKSVRDAESQPIYNPDFILDTEDATSQTRAIGVSQTLDWSGKRKARSQIADLNLRFAETEFLSLRRSFTTELLSGLATYQIYCARYELVLERLQLMNDLVDLAQNRFNAGDISQVELDLVKLAATKVRNNSVTIQAERLQAQEAVRVLTPHVDKTEWPSLPSSIPKLPRYTDLDMLVQQLPELQLAELNVQINESLTELRRTERKPDPTLSVTGGQEDDELAVGLNLTIPLFVRNSFKHEVSAAKAERDESQLMASDVLHRARVRLEISTERFSILRFAWVDWESTSEKSLSRPVDQLQRLWEKGELTTTDYVVQLTETLEVRESALELKESLWQAWFDWLKASGQIDAWFALDS